MVNIRLKIDKYKQKTMTEMFLKLNGIKTNEKEREKKEQINVKRKTNK